MARMRQRSASIANLEDLLGQVAVVLLQNRGDVRAVLELGRQVVDVLHPNADHRRVLVQRVRRHQRQVVLRSKVCRGGGGGSGRCRSKVKVGAGLGAGWGCRCADEQTAGECED